MESKKLSEENKLNDVQCIPKIALKDKRILCRDKNNNLNFFIYNLEVNSIKYLESLHTHRIGSYVEEMDAIFYTNLTLGLMGDKWNTRIIFLEEDKSYLISKKYMNLMLQNPKGFNLR